MLIQYDKEADAIYIKFKQGKYAYGKELDDLRRVDYDSKDRPIGVELLCVSRGIDTMDLPRRPEIDELLAQQCFKVLV
ncbi:MAG: DUF2283 domain-containing protein [Dehalogenimonas sp.]|jgi:uncharacterized protein YuzE|uniref:DUF2283 domain-containing protein n=1 Tax=Candidatus Dehalogenimonas loeffleri TaxID=3127115 RepID=A0ABZ2J1B4_9CHLR|nr:DUF2283 domain-containing protein [Dehalogenimonas sp.]